MRLAANLSLLFKELPLLQRPLAAAKAGFEGLEVQFPYEESATAWDRAIRDAGLPLVLMNLPPGSWSAGERGLAGLPGRRDEFKNSLSIAIAYATTLKCSRLHCLAGVKAPSLSFDAQWDCYRENLAWAAGEAAKANLTLLIEVLNPTDNPGYLLGDFDRALALLQEIGAPNLKLQFDAYHLAMLGLSLRESWQRALRFTSHVQIADQPGRHEPGTGTIDFADFFAALWESNYRGWIGCEYLPRTTTTAGLGWRQAFGFSSSMPE